MRIATSQSAGPNTHNAVFSPFDHVSVLYSNTLYYTWRPFLLLGVYTSTAIPMATVRLIVDFRNVLACRADDSTVVEHHACNRVIISICIEYIARPEIPYLVRNHVSENTPSPDQARLTLMLRSALPVTRCVSSNCKQV